MWKKNIEERAGKREKRIAEEKERPVGWMFTPDKRRWA